MIQKIRPDLKEIIHLGAAGHIDIDHFERWQQFKGLWSTEDRVLWQTSQTGQLNCILLFRMMRRRGPKISCRGPRP